MQIVGKSEKPKSREPLILLGLWLIIQVLLPSGSYERKFLRVQVPFPAPKIERPLLWLLYFLINMGLEPERV